MNAFGRTPLMHLLRFYNKTSVYKICKVLIPLYSKHDINLVDYGGNNALHHYRQSTDILDLNVV